MKGENNRERIKDVDSSRFDASVGLRRNQSPWSSAHRSFRVSVCVWRSNNSYLGDCIYYQEDSGSKEVTFKFKSLCDIYNDS